MQMTEARAKRRVDQCEQACAEIKRRFFSGQFRYTDFDAAELLHCVSVGMSGWVAVIGEPDNGSYEWIVRHDASFHGQTNVKYGNSDSGYGCSASALRDGLTEALGD